MGVKYSQSGGGGFNPFGILSTLAMLIPGGQGLSPWLMGAGALTSAANGDWAGAAKQGAGLFAGQVLDKEPASLFDPIAPTDQTANVMQYLSDNNPSVLPVTSDITANQRMLNGTESLLPWTESDSAKYNGLLAQYGLGGAKQAVGENADMGTRFMDNNAMINGKDYANRYNELLAQYGLSDMDWTGRRQRNRTLMGGI